MGGVDPPPIYLAHLLDCALTREREDDDLGAEAHHLLASRSLYLVSHEGIGRGLGSNGTS